jgi:hypothetical protein
MLHRFRIVRNKRRARLRITRQESPRQAGDGYNMEMSQYLHIEHMGLGEAADGVLSCAGFGPTSNIESLPF